QARQTHRRIDELRADFGTGKRAAVESCIAWVLAASRYPSTFPTFEQSPIFLPKPRQLLLEYRFPLVDDIVPKESSWRYVKSKDQLEATKRPLADRRERYRRALSHIAL